MSTASRGTSRTAPADSDCPSEMRRGARLPLVHAGGIETIHLRKETLDGTALRSFLKGMKERQGATGHGLRAGRFFLLRAPLLPVDELRRFGEDLVAPASSPDSIAAGIASDRAQLLERLRKLVARPDVAEAVFAAAPTLADRLAKWSGAPDGKDAAKVENVLVRYFQRMT